MLLSLIERIDPATLTQNSLRRSGKSRAADSLGSLLFSAEEVESVRTAGIVDPTEKAIAVVAYQLWLDNGCPIGSDQEHWFRAEAILRNALVAMFEELSRRSWIPQCDTLADSEIVAEFTWDGHWEVWEREWGSARWVSDVDDPGVRVSNRAA